jgi:acyl dehydratase
MTSFYEDLRIGTHFVSPSKALSQVDIDRFAEITGDFNPIHIDEKRAHESIFGGTIAHGLLVLSAALGIWYEMGVTRDSLIALIGIENVSFRAPVRPGGRFHLVSKVASRRPSRSRLDAGIVKLKDSIVDEESGSFVDFERILMVKRAKPRTKKK